MVCRRRTAAYHVDCSEKVDFVNSSDTLEGTFAFEFYNSNVLAPPLTRLSLLDVSFFELFLFNLLLLPSCLRSTTPPKRPISWENHGGGLAGHAHTL